MHRCWNACSVDVICVFLQNVEDILSMLLNMLRNLQFYENKRFVYGMQQNRHPELKEQLTSEMHFGLCSGLTFNNFGVKFGRLVGSKK